VTSNRQEANYLCIYSKSNRIITFERFTGKSKGGCDEDEIIRFVTK